MSPLVSLLSFEAYVDLFGVYHLRVYEPRSQSANPEVMSLTSSHCYCSVSTRLPPQFPESSDKTPPPHLLHLANGVFFPFICNCPVNLPQVMGQQSLSSSDHASSTEILSVGLIRSLKYFFQHSTTSSVEVWGIPYSCKQAGRCFTLLRCPPLPQSLLVWPMLSQNKVWHSIKGERSTQERQCYWWYCCLKLFDHFSNWKWI